MNSRPCLRPAPLPVMPPLPQPLVMVRDAIARKASPSSPTTRTVACEEAGASQ